MIFRLCLLFKKFKSHLDTRSWLCFLDNMFKIYFYSISLFTQFILLFEQLINKYQRWDPHENPRSKSAREGRGALPGGRVAFRCRGFNASSHLFVDPVLSGSHVSGFGWEQLLCCQFLYEAERPPRPFAFLPTSPHPFAVIALSPSFFHRPYQPELALLSSLGGVWRLRDPSPTFLRRCSSTSRPRPRTPWTISVTSRVLALS